MLNTSKIVNKLSTLIFTLICLYSYIVNQSVCLDYNESNKKNEIELKEIMFSFYNNKHFKLKHNFDTSRGHFANSIKSFLENRDYLKLDDVDNNKNNNNNNQHGKIINNLSNTVQMVIKRENSDIDSKISNNNNSSKNSKLYLEDMMNDLDEDKEEIQNGKSNKTNENYSSSSSKMDKYDNEMSRGSCNLKQIEISLNIKNCGRITINTTACGGLCKSSERIVANTKLMKKSCSACKAHKFVDLTYKIKCVDNSFIYYKLKEISACTCFKHINKIIPIRAIHNSSK